MRTTVELVEEILGDNYGRNAAGESPSLQPYIDIATVLVDRVAACAVRKGQPLTSTELELIERWLAAHAYCLMDPTYTSKSTGGASGSFTGVFGKYLEGTRYGQMAISIDPSGCLVAIASGSERKVARVMWLGKTEGEQLTYDERN